MICANSQMKKIIRKFLSQQKSHKNKVIIESEIEDLLSKLKINHEGAQKWISFQNDNRTYEDIIRQYKALTDYEWDVFELYFDRKIVKRKYSRFIHTLIISFEQLKREYLHQEAVCFIVMVQKGKFSNVSARFHLLREGEFYINNIDEFKQPILYTILEN